MCFPSVFCIKKTAHDVRLKKNKKIRNHADTISTLDAVYDITIWHQSQDIFRKTKKTATFTQTKMQDKQNKILKRQRLLCVIIYVFVLQTTKASWLLIMQLYHL